MWNLQAFREDPDAVFNFVPIPGEKNTFAISLQSQQKFIGTKVIVLTSGNTALAPYMSEHTSLDQVQNSGNYDDFKFVIEKEAHGVYAIKQGNNPWKDTPVTGVTLITGETVYWRIITTNLDWSVEEIGTSMLTPILSEPTTDFGANNTLTNCGTGTLEQTIGSNQTQSFVNSVGWEGELFADRNSFSQYYCNSRSGVYCWLFWDRSNIHRLSFYYG